MLAASLKLATSQGRLRFVGGRASGGESDQLQAYSIDLLEGGLGSAPVAGDLVLACIGCNDSTDFNIQVTTAGYTKLVDLSQIGSGETGRSNLAVFYKVLTTPETSVGFDFGVFPGRTRFAVHVWRGANAASPIDTATQSYTAAGTAVANAPSITTASKNCVVIAVGSGAASSAASGYTSIEMSQPADMKNFFGTSGSKASISGNITSIAIASIVRSPIGSYDPPVFGGGGSSIANESYCAATIALRSA
jgi:hypothetical protein